MNALCQQAEKQTSSLKPFEKTWKKLAKAQEHAERAWMAVETLKRQHPQEWSHWETWRARNSTTTQGQLAGITR